MLDLRPLLTVAALNLAAARMVDLAGSIEALSESERPAAARNIPQGPSSRIIESKGDRLLWRHFGAIVGAAFPPGSTSGTAGLLRWGTVPIVLINETLWYGSLALLSGVTPFRNHYRRIKAVFERSCGGLLIVFGAKVTWSGAHDSELPS